MYTRLWVKAKTFCCGTNEALPKKLHCYRKKEIIKIKIRMVTENRDWLIVQNDFWEFCKML
jgi:hypothetical protein